MKAPNDAVDVKHSAKNRGLHAASYLPLTPAQEIECLFTVKSEIATLLALLTTVRARVVSAVAVRVLDKEKMPVEDSFS